MDSHGYIYADTHTHSRETDRDRDRQRDRQSSMFRDEKHNILFSVVGEGPLNHYDHQVYCLCHDCVLGLLQKKEEKIKKVKVLVNLQKRYSDLMNIATDKKKDNAYCKFKGKFVDVNKQTIRELESLIEILETIITKGMNMKINVESNANIRRSDRIIARNKNLLEKFTKHLKDSKAISQIYEKQ